MKKLIPCDVLQGPVVQSIFFVDKMREAFAHIFSTKNIGIFEILTFESLTKC